MENNLKVESGYQLFKRITQRPMLDGIHPLLFPNGGLHPNTVLQITGAPSTGKTLLLTELIARCILPEAHLGKNCGAILINTDHHFNLLRLIALMESLNVPRTTIENSLKNLTILNCYSSEQTRLTYRNLERVLTDNTNIGILLVDSILTHYWYEQSVHGRNSMNAHAISALNEIKTAVGDHGVVTVFTKGESEKPLYYNVNYTVYLRKGNDGCFVATTQDHDLKMTSEKRYTIGRGFTFLD